MSLISNITVYLSTKYNLNGIYVVNVVNIWSGTSNVATLAGAFIADTCLGRYRTLLYGSIASFLVLSTYPFEFINIYAILLIPNSFSLGDGSCYAHCNLPPAQTFSLQCSKSRPLPTATFMAAPRSLHWSRFVIDRRRWHSSLQRRIRSRSIRHHHRKGKVPIRKLL